MGTWERVGPGRNCWVKKNEDGSMFVAALIPPPILPARDRSSIGEGEARSWEKKVQKDKHD
jgi:hypothetical protein